MLVAYILTKSRFLKLRLIRKTSQEKFTYKDKQYNIDQNCVYLKRFLGFKLFTWSMYVEGVVDPLEFTNKGYRVVSSTPLNVVAKLMYKLKLLFYEKILIGLMIINLIAIILLYVSMNQ